MKPSNTISSCGAVTALLHRTGIRGQAIVGLLFYRMLVDDPYQDRCLNPWLMYIEAAKDTFGWDMEDEIADYH